LICNHATVPLSSVNNDLDGIGYHGAELLHRLMSGEPAPAVPAVIPPQGITTRRSTDLLAVSDEPTRRALQYLQQNFRRNSAADDAATASGLSRRRLEHAFRRHIGRSVCHQLNLLRLRRAKELVVTTDLSIADIASHAGFNTPQYFSNVFRKATGMTPRTFRRRHHPQRECRSLRDGRGRDPDSPS
jgi:LacI family transcriptional regulator